jgi:hypothetical protein
MRDVVNYFVVVILLVAGFVIYPAMLVAEKHDKLAEKVADQALIEFVDLSRAKGYVDPRDYDVFIKKIGSSGLLFNVSLEYYKKRFQPNYIDPANFATFQNTFEVLYDGYFTNDILNILYPGTTVAEDSTTRRYKMRVGDYFNVRIVSNEQKVSSIIRGTFGFGADVPVPLSYGGMVRNESP